MENSRNKQFIRFIFYFAFRDRVSFCYPGWSAVVQPWLTVAASTSHLSLPSSWDSRRAPPCPTNFFVFLVETGFHHVDQYGLDLLTLWSTRLSLPKCWDYRREPLRPATCSVFKKTNKLSFRVAVPFYMPTSNVSVVKFLYILTSIWCCLHFLIN